MVVALFGRLPNAATYVEERALEKMNKVVLMVAICITNDRDRRLEGILDCVNSKNNTCGRFLSVFGRHRPVSQRPRPGVDE